MSDCSCHSIVKLAPYKRGTTWDGLTDFTLSPAHDEALSAVSIAFVQAGVTVLTISSADSNQVEITNAASWVFDIKDQVLAIPNKGQCSLEIRTTDATGFIREFPPIFLPVN